MRLIVKLISTGLGFGYLKPFPGTWGTMPGIVICYLLFPLGLAYQFAALGFFFVLSVWASSKAEKIFGHDSKKIVIDEIAGITLTMMVVPNPNDWRYYLIGFILFRIFDVAKIEPASSAEKLPSGWGVTADDIVAGVYSWITLQLIAHFVIKL
jgi:phosphatidylglycerophosphatase A